jgi:hypothetical protein
MKRFRIFSLILAVLLVFGLSFIACDNGSTGGSGGGGGSFAKTNWRSDFNYGGLLTIEMKLSFITSEDWAVYENIPDTDLTSGSWMQAMAGTYTVSGGTAMLMAGIEGLVGKATISGNTLTMIGTLATFGSSWTRE